MARPARGAIDNFEAAYIKALLEGTDSSAKKIALQRLCKHYRDGFKLRNPNAIRLLLISLLYDADLKIIRWAANTLAFFGGRGDVVAIADAIDRNRFDPDILGAGIAALAAIVNEDRLRQELDSRDLPLRGATLLAAAQKLPSLSVNLSKERINIQNAGIAELRLAAVLVGIDKAPDNMFSIDHHNGDVLGSLNGHDDHIVAQYSIWAMTEHPALGLNHLRVPLFDVSSQRENIRGYIYQLVAESSLAAYDNQDFISEATKDSCVEARRHLARGFKETYFIGVDGIVTSWLLDEPDIDTCWNILEHMGRYAHVCSGYNDFVIDAYKNEGEGSIGRLRLEAAVRGTPLARDLGRIKYASDVADLFGFGGSMTTNNTFNAPVNAGAFAAGGTATSGDVTFNQQQAVDQAAILLKDLAKLINEAKAQLPSEVQEAVKSPTKSKVQSVLDWLKVGSEGASLATSVAAAAPAIATQLGGLLEYLPT